MNTFSPAMIGVGFVAFSLLLGVVIGLMQVPMTPEEIAHANSPEGIRESEDYREMQEDQALARARSQEMDDCFNDMILRI